MNNKKD